MSLPIYFFRSKKLQNHLLHLQFYCSSLAMLTWDTSVSHVRARPHPVADVVTLMVWEEDRLDQNCFCNRPFLLSYTTRFLKIRALNFHQLLTESLSKDLLRQVKVCKQDSNVGKQKLHKRRFEVVSFLI